jgi:hypothetical protein
MKPTDARFEGKGDSLRAGSSILTVFHDIASSTARYGTSNTAVRTVTVHGLL